MTRSRVKLRQLQPPNRPYRVRDAPRSVALWYRTSETGNEPRPSHDKSHANHGRPDSRLWRRNLGSSPFYRHSRNHPAWQEKKNRRKNAVDHSWNDEALARAKTAPTRLGGVTRI